MKSLKKILVLVSLAVLFATGCGSTKTMTCTRTMNQNGMNADLRYEVEYKGETVSKVKSTEKLTMDDASVLDTYKASVEKTYEPYKDLEHYDYKVEIQDNTLVSTVEIDYSQIDTEKMISIDSANGSLIKNGKIKINDLKSVYEASGITCEK